LGNLDDIYDKSLKGDGKFFWCDDEQFKVHARGCHYLPKDQETILCPTNGKNSVKEINECPLVSENNFVSITNATQEKYVEIPLLLSNQ